MSGQFTVSTGLSHDELVRVEALRLAIEQGHTSKDYHESSVVLDIARKFEAFIRDKVKG